MFLIMPDDIGFLTDDDFDEDLDDLLSVPGSQMFIFWYRRDRKGKKCERLK